MTIKQVVKLAGQLVEHQAAFENMSSGDRQWVIQNTKEAIDLFGDAVRNRSQKSPLDLSMVTGGYRDDLVTVLCEFDASEVFSFDLSDHFNNGRSRAAKPGSLQVVEKDVPARVIKLIRINRLWGSRHLSVVRGLGFEPVVSFAQVYEFLSAWDEKDIQWFDKVPEKSFEFLVNTPDMSDMLCHVNRQNENSDLSKDWFLGCKDLDEKMLGYNSEFALVS